MNFLRLKNEVRAAVPGEVLSLILAARLVNRALGEIYRERNWSFLNASGFFSAVDSVSTGTVSVTQFSKVVEPNGAAATAWGAMGVAIAITDRQFRLLDGPLYQITDYDATGDEDWNTNQVAGAIQLEDAYQGETDASADYEIYRAYFRPPETDFLRLAEVIDTNSQVRLRLDLGVGYLDTLDPQRTSTGTPQVVAPLELSASGHPLFEIHPHVKTARVMPIRYLRKGAELTSNTDEPPAIIPDELILAKALWHACMFANTRKSHQELKGIDWLAEAALHEADYQKTLIRVKRQDEELYPQNVIRRESFYGFSDEWARTHAV
jgi:hypothetical protein